MINLQSQSKSLTELENYLEFLEEKNVKHEFSMWKLKDSTQLQHVINNRTITLLFDRDGKLCNANFDGVDVNILVYKAIKFCMGTLLDFVPRDRSGFDGKSFN